MIPDPPAFTPDEQADGELQLRYEEVTQDGRVRLTALPHAIGSAVWQPVLDRRGAARALRDDGLAPLLTRLVVEGGSEPVSVRRPLAAEGGYRLAHTAGADGAVERLLLDVWVTLRAPIARTHGPPPPRAGEIAVAGRVFAEHVFSRLFAPPGERRVTRFSHPALPAVPPDRRAWRPPEDLLDAPAGAAALDHALLPDDAPVVFGVADTDSNHHVNSLVYPRLFEQAALRRLVARGRPAAVQSRRLEVGYRKPCFAGDRMRVVLRAFALGDDVVAVGAFVPEGDPAARPHVYLRMGLSPSAPATTPAG